MQHIIGDGMLLEQTSQFFDPGDEPFLRMLSGGGTLGQVRSEADVLASQHAPIRPLTRQQSMPQPHPPSGRHDGAGDRPGPSHYQPQGGVPALMPRKGPAVHGSHAAGHPGGIRSGVAGPRDQRAAIELACLLGMGGVGGGSAPDRSGPSPERYRDGPAAPQYHQQQPLPGHLASHLQQQQQQQQQPKRPTSPVRQATLVPISETMPRQPSPRPLSPAGTRGVTYQHHPPPQFSPRGHAAASGVSSPAAPCGPPRGDTDGYATTVRGPAAAAGYSGGAWERTGGGGHGGGGHSGSLSREASRRASMGPPGQISAEYSSRRVSYTNDLARRASMGAHPSVDLGSVAHSSGPLPQQRHDPWDSPAQSDRLLRRLEEANTELQDRLVAAHASHADAQAQVAALEAAHRSLEAQLHDLREKMRAGEPALEAVHRQLDCKAAEARRALDIAAEAERVREHLETEMAGLKEETVDLRRELEAANRKVAVEADSARRADGEVQTLRRDLAAATEALDKAHAEGNSMRERLQAAEGEATRRSAAAELEAERLGQQLREARERCTAAEARIVEMQQQLGSAQMELVFLRRELDAARVDASSSRAASMAAASAAAAAQQQVSVLRASTPAYAPPPPIAVGGPWGGGGYMFVGSPQHHLPGAWPAPSSLSGAGAYDSPAGGIEAMPSSLSVFREASQAQLWSQQQQAQQQQQQQVQQQQQQQQQAQQQAPSLGMERSWYGSPGHSGMPQGPLSPGLPSVSPGRPATAATGAPPSPTRADAWQSRPWENSGAAAAAVAPAAAMGALPATGGGQAAGPSGFGGQPAPMHEGAPFGTELSVQEIMSRTKAAEDDLLRACQERDELESELSRMPLGGGRTIRQRQRKEFIETRLDELRSKISSARMQIKRLGGGK